MKIYSSGNQLIWMMIGFVLVSLLILIGMGSFLFGTPLGLAILTILVIRHFYKKRKYRQAYENIYGTDYTSTHEGPKTKWEFGNSTQNNFEDKTEAFENKKFTREAVNTAEDVEFKEIK